MRATRQRGPARSWAKHLSRQRRDAKPTLWELCESGVVLRADPCSRTASLVRGSHGASEFWLAAVALGSVGWRVDY